MAQDKSYGLSLGWPTGPGFATIVAGTEAAALFARMTVQPPDPFARHIDRHIRQLVDSGLWAKLTIYRWTALHDAQAATLNWKGSSFPASHAGTDEMEFVPYKGFTADGTLFHFTGYNPSSSGGWSQNNHAFGGIVQRVPTAVTGFNMWGNQSNRLNFSAGGAAVSIRSGNTASNSIAVNNNLGRIGVTRVSSAGYSLIKDGAVTAQTQASQAVLNQSCYEGAQNTSSAASAGVRLANHWVGQMTVADVQTLHALQAEFMAQTGLQLEVG